jgi:predicted nucleic acid-binding protein
MTVVSDTGPLIGLAKVNQLSLLKRLFGEVCIPQAVHRELLAKAGPETARLDEALASFIRVRQPSSWPAEVKAATLRLATGEQQAIALACELGVLLVMDERLGRAAARRLGLSVTGLAGVLVRAKECGLIPAVRPILDGIRQRGYWLSDELVDAAARLAGDD